MDLLYVAGSEIQIFHERSKIVALYVFRAHGSEVQIFHERSRTVDLFVHRWSEVQVSLLNFKVVNFDCIKPRALRGS